MPELPEVETIKRQLNEKLIGLKITDFWWDTPKMVRGRKEEIVGAKIRQIRRRAKLLEIDLSNGRTILIHLKLTGQLIYQSPHPSASRRTSYQGNPLPPLKKPIPNSSTHIIFHFDNGGTLYFNDLRKFGFVKILTTQDVEHTRILNEFGPEPLDPDFKLEDFAQRLKRRKNSKIKQLLLDQKFIAGVGNVYANEALFRARINPQKRAGELTEAEIARLLHDIKSVLHVGVLSGGASEATYVNLFGEEGRFMEYAKIYGKKGQKCPECAELIERISLGGRGTFYCPTCQIL